MKFLKRKQFLMFRVGVDTLPTFAKSEVIKRVTNVKLRILLEAVPPETGLCQLIVLGVVAAKVLADNFLLFSNVLFAVLRCSLGHFYWLLFLVLLSLYVSILWIIWCSLFMVMMTLTLDLQEDSVAGQAHPETPVRSGGQHQSVGPT